MQWLRLYHDTITDPKWRLVANDSGQTEANVLAVWMHMMINASASSERGTLEGWNDRIVAASLGIPGDAVTAIREAMQGLVLEGQRLTGWDKRQRASDNVADRVQRHRNKAKEPGPGGGSGNGFDNGGHNMSRDANDTVTLHAPDVTLHPTNETLPPLRAQTPDLERKKKGSVAKATAADAAPGSTVLPFPIDDKAKLHGPVLSALVGRMPKRDPEQIRALLTKAFYKIDPQTALDLGAMAALKDEPWSWLCKAVDARLKPKPAAGGRQAGGRPLEAGAAEFLELFERKKAELS